MGGWVDEWMKAQSEVFHLFLAWQTLGSQRRTRNHLDASWMLLQTHFLRENTMFGYQVAAAKLSRWSPLRQASALCVFLVSCQCCTPCCYSAEVNRSSELFLWPLPGFLLLVLDWSWILDFPFVVLFSMFLSFFQVLVDLMWVLWAVPVGYQTCRMVDRLLVSVGRPLNSSNRLVCLS